MKIKTLSLLLYTIAATLFIHTTFADQEFTTDYNIKYTFGEDGVTQAEQKISITNLRNDIVATTYSLDIKQIRLYDISASDDKNNLDVTQDSNNDETKLDVHLGKFTVGQGRQNNFTIKYSTKDISYKIGDIWNINIPRSQTLDATSSYNVSISIPKSFGPKIFISPTPINIEQLTDNTIYYFNKDQLGNKNITAAFGTYQLLNFRLRYQLYNPNLFTSNYEIALPPDIAWSQQVLFQSLNMTPNKIYTDKDGNTIAVYRLKPKQRIDVEFIGAAKVFGKQINVNLGGAFNEIPKAIKQTYLRKQKFWETDAQNVKDIAKSLYDPNLNVTKNAQKIYDYIISNYSYDLNNLKKDFVDRQGATKALADKSQWACMEFTDSFIAIARAMGIPAREINGYAASGSDKNKPLSITIRNVDFLHAWPEYYDQAFGWVQIDPTWGDTSNTDYFTKLDTSHFAFVIKGINSDYPLPAGTYRLDNDQKLVDVSFTQQANEPDFTEKVVVKKTFNFNIIEILKGNNRYLVRNTGAVTIYTPMGKAIYPGQETAVYFSKKINYIELKNFNGETLKIDL
jgi:transglutaminase-like putative cysteine protease